MAVPSSSMPSVPFEKIELDSIASALPEITWTPASVLKAMVLPWARDEAADRVARRIAEIVMPSISLPSGRCPVMSVPIEVAVDRVRPTGRSAGRRSISMPPVVGRDQVPARRGGRRRSCCPRRRRSIRMPCWALGRAIEPVLSVPMNVPSIRAARAASVELDPHVVARDDLRAAGAPLDRDADRRVDEHALVDIAQVELARQVGADQVADDGDPRGRRARDVDADLVGRDDVARPDLIVAAR